MLTIRTAELDDAPAIARVHVETWRSTYGGIVPQTYLDGLTVPNRAVAWTRLLEQSGRSILTMVSEDHNRRIVGFVSGGALRHADARFQAEISSLYVMQAYQGAGHGRRLFMAASNRLAQLGYTGLFVWVLADNPARAFYEALGGEAVSEMTREFAGKSLREIGYGWTDIPRYD
jgi:ribosomal protein S18 acetylase RimI-like enzyme